MARGESWQTDEAQIDPAPSWRGQQIGFRTRFAEGVRRELRYQAWQAFEAVARELNPDFA